MSISTANRVSTGQVGLARVERKVYQSTHIYGGTFVCTNATGYLIAAADVSGAIFDGYAESEADNSAGNSGDKVCVVTPRHGNRLSIVECDAVSPDQSWINQEVAIADDHTAALVAQTSHVVRLGRIVDVIKTGTSGRVWVDTNDISATALAGT